MFGSPKIESEPARPREKLDFVLPSSSPSLHPPPPVWSSAHRRARSSWPACLRATKQAFQTCLGGGGERREWIEGTNGKPHSRKDFGAGKAVCWIGVSGDERNKQKHHVGGGTCQKTPRTSSCGDREARGRNGTTTAHVPQLPFFSSSLSLLSVPPPPLLHRACRHRTLGWVRLAVCSYE